ncbi:hypothetical protein [Citricoccus sp.]|uniref:hypothetical protein n=1 Tax=Citricoccus sp. TaxID=1978372 RepID=UPI0028BE578D|nr:hypothetical protein [Citricoccus sp.]
MPTYSLAFWEGRVRADLPNDERNVVRRVAKLAKRRHAAFTREPTDQEMLQFYSSITYADPTPYKAIDRSNARAAIRRLGVAV